MKISRKARIEYFWVTLAMTLSAGMVYFFAISLEQTVPTIHATGLGVACGCAIASLLHGIILFVRYISKRSRGLKIACAALWPLSAAIIMYVGVFSFIPYAIYNLVMICIYKEPEPTEWQFPELVYIDPKQGAQDGNQDS